MGLSVYPAAGGVATLREQIFRSSGTWTYPSSSLFNGEVDVLAVGGGGGGASSYQSSASDYTLGGAGGGGGVIQKKLNVLNLGNQTVTIGAGGLGGGTSGRSYSGSYGEDTIFGSPTYVNLSPNPRCIGQGGMYDWFAELAATTSIQLSANTVFNAVQTSLGSYSVPNDATNGLWTFANIGNIFSFAFKVTSGDVVHWAIRGLHANTGGGAYSVTPYLQKYNSTTPNSYGGTQIAGTAFNWNDTDSTYTGSFTATWTGWARLRFHQAASWGTYQVGILGNGVRIGSPVDLSITGNTAGYEWAGGRYNSETIVSPTGNSFIIARGGGGGMSSGSQGTLANPKATSGGQGTTATTSTIGYTFAGSGGGAGGPATHPIWNTPSGGTTTVSSSTSFSSAVGAGSSLHGIAVEFHKGSMGFTMSSSSSATYPGVRGKAGPGLYGYGAGGSYLGIANQMDAWGKYYEAPDAFLQEQGYVAAYAQYKTNRNSLPNTGRGGDSWVASNGSGFSYPGANGGSGIVIVRWYE